MEPMIIVTSATVATALIEGIKWLVKKINPDKKFELPMKFYYFLLPVLSFAVEPVMSLIGFVDYSLPVDWVGWVLELLRVMVTAALSVVLYENSIAKLKIAKAEKEMAG